MWRIELPSSVCLAACLAWLLVKPDWWLAQADEIVALQQRLAETEESLKRELHCVALLDAELERLRASPTCRLRSRRAPFLLLLLACTMPRMHGGML
jgi:hypothetical protein